MDGTPYRTLQANTEKEGAQLIDYLENKTTNILKRHGFSKDGAYKGDPGVFGSSTPVLLTEQIVETAAEHINDNYSSSDLLCNPVSLEDPATSVNIAIDDVNVKRQRSERRKCPADSDEPAKRKFAHNTVARIDYDQKHYSLVGGSIKLTLRYVIAFLLSNNLLGYRFQFFTDGHTILNDTIVRFFK